MTLSGKSRGQAANTSSPTDVVIVGGGIIGMSIAWRLAQNGARLTVIDAGTVGNEASWAGAGMLAPGGEIEKRSESSDFALHSLRLYPSFIAELQSESGVEIDFRESGAIDLAFDEKEWRALEARARLQAALGIVSVPQTLSRFYPGDAIVNPRDVMKALQAACLARGVSFRENEAVLKIRSEKSICVETPLNNYMASCAVLAAGAWSGSIPIHVNAMREKTPATFPIRGHLLGYQLEPGSVGTIIRHGHTYILQRANGFTIAGSSSERVGFNREIDPAIVADIDARARHILPRLPDPISWLGFRPATESLIPEIRRIPGSRVWLAYGHYRNGILLAPATAEKIAGEIIASSETGWSSPGDNR